MRKRVVLVAAVIAGLTSTMLSAPAAHAVGLVPDPVLAACIAQAIEDATGTTVDYQTYGISQADFDALRTSGGTDNLACWGVSSLEGVQYLPLAPKPDASADDLITLIFNGGAITDLSPLSALTQLQYLDLSQNNITNISPLSGLTNLERLFLYQNHIASITALQGMTKLQYVALSENSIKDLSPLNNHNALIYLEAHENQISSLPAFTGMTKLDTLDLGSNKLTSVAQLTGLSAPLVLMLGGNQISTLTGLPTSVTDLSIDQNKVSDLSPVAKLKNLEAISFSDNQVKDLSPLSGLPKLDYVLFNNNAVTDLKPLASSPGILAGGQVYFTQNHVADMSPIRPCTRAQNLGGNTASCTSFSGVAETLTGSATTGVAQALPTVIGQSDDPVTWKVVTGAATISGGKVTFNSPGTFKLRFQDRSDSGDGYRLEMSSAAECAEQGGTWDTTDPNYPMCLIMADLSGVVTYTVTNPATQYTVTFNPAGGTVSPTSKVVKIGDALGALPTPTRAGFTFDGWYSQASGGVKYTSATVLTTKTDVTIYAHWIGKKYTITFNPNGGSTPKTGSKATKTTTVIMGQTYGRLPSTTRKNYNLLGWFTAKSGGTPVTASTIVTTASNATLYAHWALKTFTVKLNPRSGTVSPTSITVTYGKKYAGLPTPVRAGYTFKGWFTKTSGGTKVTSKTTVTLTKGQTLYAQWSAKKYKITFNPNGGSTPKTGSTVTKSKTVTFGKTFGTLTTTKLSGLKFAGWWTDPDGGTQVTAKSKVIFTANTILYAHWI